MDIEHFGVQMPQAKNGRLAGRAASSHARREVIELGQIAIDVQPRIVLQRDQQSAFGKIGVRDFPVGEFTKSPPRLGRMDDCPHTCRLSECT